MDNTASVKTNNRKVWLNLAYIFTSLLVLFFTLALGPKLIDEYLEIIISGAAKVYIWEGLVMEFTYYIFIIGFVISWWKKCIGGIIILLASVFQMAPFLIIDGNLGSLIFGIPLLISGILFIIASRIDC